MSAQFGIYNFDGRPADAQELARVRSVLLPYGPDAEGSFCKDQVGILYRAFFTTQESRLEQQPHVSPSGPVITWDGRLDNRRELIHELGAGLSNDSTDVSIVADAYRCWGGDSFAKLIGDWAVSIWDPGRQTLLLAKDFAGTRHLYYSIEGNQLTWCSILDPLVRLTDRRLTLEEEYIAGWLSFFPAEHLTPYVGIHSVPSASVVAVRFGKCAVHKYWDFSPARRTRYRTDAEYEDHFRSVFFEAVRRRLRSDSPILAELSGGMDSSSIVCVADALLAQGTADTPRLDTVSYYDDSEPNWNERPYFTIVERKRGRSGCHIDVSSQKTRQFEFHSDRFAATPASQNGCGESARRFAACATSQGNRAILSGIAGDEVTGGVPTPVPELMDLMARARLGSLAHQLKSWALEQRKPWPYLLKEAARAFFPPALVGVPKYKEPPNWLDPGFVKRNRQPLQGYECRTKVFGAFPSFQDNMAVLDALRRQLACDALQFPPLFEKSYPYLDRSLLEFLYSVPRQQLVRPGQRRSLMRRALRGIVPNELLDRRRKAYVARAPIDAISSEWTRLLARHLVSSSLKIVDPRALFQALQRARHGQGVALVPLMRLATMEAWLQHLTTQALAVSFDELSQGDKRLHHPRSISAERNQTERR